MSEQPKQSPGGDSFDAEVGDRFGVLPNFFRLAPEAPEITSNLWEFAKFGYLDNPLPSLFKERLFVYLSRFCEVRYCIARHLGFLIGLGRPSGDRQASAETLDQVVRLIRRPLPRGEALEPSIAMLEALDTPLSQLPESGTPQEEVIFACATHVFLQTPDATRCLEALCQVFDGAMFQHLLVFLTFVRTAHFWTKLHPELTVEQDISDLLAVHEGLAECVGNDPEAGACDTTQVLLNELSTLRREKEQAARLRVTLDSIGDAVITTDADGRITNLNPVAESLTGWQNSEAASRPIDEVFHIVNEHSGLRVDDPLTKASREEVVVGLAAHTVLIAKDGVKRPIDDSVAPIRFKDGEVIGFVLVFRDVTERRQSERRLLENEERYRALVTATAQVVWTTDAEGRVVEDSPSWRAFTGQNFDQWKDWGWLDAIHPDDRERASTTWSAAVESKSIYLIEYRVRHMDGTYRWTAARGVPVLEPDRHIREWVGTNTDITDHKVAEAELRASEERVRLALDSAELGTWHLDPATMAMRTDERFRAILGATIDSLDYEQLIAIIHPDDQGRVQAAVAAATRIDDPEPYAIDYRVLHPDGSLRWVFAKGRVNFEEVGSKRQLASFDGTVADITEQRRIQEELREIAARLSEADRRKDEFLATLAHELRNPLAPIRTGLEVMKFAKDDPEMMEEIRDTMERQAKQMVRLIDDLLDVSRITQGKLELRTCRVELAEIVQSAVEATQPFIDEANHELSVTLPSQRVLLHADPNRLAQVFSNLLNNSTKYTPDGGRISISVEQQGIHAVVTVRDSGIGIPSEMQNSIFEMFSQIDRPLEKGYTGLGIGLTLVRRLVEMHGGQIEVFSEGSGRGSQFIITLPVLVESAIEPLPIPANASHSRSRRILVADDNADAAGMLSLVVKMLGNEVRLASDGLQAVRVAEEFRPDVVLMDIRMPQMNGYEAARHIRLQPWGKDIVLVALTGWGQDEDKQRANEAGFNHHLVKPAEPSELQRLLTQLQD